MLRLVKELEKYSQIIQSKKVLKLSLEKVKKKFYKGSSKARGTGIGLAVCDEIVGLHGGTLTLENAEGGGTLVTIALPATQE